MHSRSKVNLVENLLDLWRLPLRIPKEIIMALRTFRTTFGVFCLFLVMLLGNIGKHGCQGTQKELGVLQSWLTQIQDPHASLHDWVSSATSPCDWTGIQCYSGQIVQINLSNMGLRGELNPVLGQLEFLTSFNISINDFSGGIPPEICSWSNLQALALHSNSFAGTIPSCLSQLSQLRVMDLSYNSFTYLPAGIGLFAQLSVLNVEGCALNGTIPPAISNISTLTSLSLGDNKLTGLIPPELSNLRGLQRMHLGYNSLVGQIPWQLGLMGSLKYLNLAENNLTGEVPSILWNLLHLEKVELFGNRLNGTISANIGNAASLTSLDISDNFLDGSIPEEIGNAQSLEFLNLSKNELVGPIPLTLSILPGLRVLSLSLNKLTGSIPQGFGVHSNLSTLEFSSNQLVELIPSGLCRSGGLSILDLSYNFIYGSIPKDLQSCGSLQRLILSHNGLWGSLPDAIGTIPMLSYLDISSNRLTGTLDNALFGSESTSLMELYLQDNQLMGSLPESMGAMENLSKLDVSQNNFSGEIPPQLGNCTKLTQLILQGNNFYGAIPQEISHSKKLQVINLSWNALNGTIPILLGSVLAMEDLDLSHNRFNGSIAGELANCSSLGSLDLSYNNFSGQVPLEGVFERITNIFLAGNPLLCGGPARLKLPICAQDQPITSIKIVTVILVVLSILVFAVAFWWEGRDLGIFHDMQETAPGQACASKGQANVAASGRAFVERDLSIWEPELEPAGNLEDEEELTVFHSTGQVEPNLDEENETVQLPKISVSFDAGLKPWKLVLLAQELDLTDVEVHRTCAPHNLFCRADVAEMYMGITKNGLHFVVKKHLAPQKGENLCNILRRLGQFRHPHIVKLFGYCLDREDNSLVAVLCENMLGGNLREALEAGKLSRRPHKFGVRVDIALGIASGLHYLHDIQLAYGAPLHERITSSCVYLDLNMKAYLSVRVELSELDPSQQSSSERLSTSEQMSFSCCRRGADIYDLGVVLLELLSGRPVVAPNGMHIVNWYIESTQTGATVSDLLDPTLGSYISAETGHRVKSLFSLAAKCIDVRPEGRPTLDEMQKYLQGLSRAITDELPPPRGLSGPFQYI